MPKTVCLYAENVSAFIVTGFGKDDRRMYDVIILGAGPAGLGAAIYGMRAGLQLVVLDRSPVSGGQVLTTYEVDNYLGFPGISGGEISEKFREHADKLGVPFEVCDVQEIIEQEDRKIVVTEQGNYEAKTVIIATGAKHSMLGVEGEMKLAGMGVSYCATCDGAFFRKRTVAVVGGGDVAVEDAIFLAGLCKKVYLIHRRDSLRAAKRLQDQVMALENVEIIWNSEVTRIFGEDMVEQVYLHDNRSNQDTLLDVNGVFVAVGVVPNTAFCKGLLEMDEQGYILADETCKTSREGIFAVGDIRKKPLRQIITAVADGANAISSVQNCLNEITV